MPKDLQSTEAATADLIHMAAVAKLWRGDAVELPPDRWWHYWHMAIRIYIESAVRPGGIIYSPTFNDVGPLKWFTLCGIKFYCGMDGYDDHVKSLVAADMI